MQTAIHSQIGESLGLNTSRSERLLNNHVFAMLKGETGHGRMALWRSDHNDNFRVGFNDLARLRHELDARPPHPKVGPALATPRADGSLEGVAFWY